VGVFLQEEGAPVYEDILVQQEQKVIAERGPGDVAALLRSGETWTIR
jgi:hypothetical protein